MVGCVLLLEVAPRRVEAAELDRHAGADADQRCKGALVEGSWALIFEDRGSCCQGGCVCGGCLQADLHYVEGLA